jgi:hypothetical protein
MRHYPLARLAVGRIIRAPVVEAENSPISFFYDALMRFEPLARALSGNHFRLASVEPFGRLDKIRTYDTVRHGPPLQGS